ncbi:hypothetical protein Tco_1140070, partial [Tanacetum coccineum]
MPGLPTRPIWVNPEDDTIYLDIEFDPPSLALVQNLTSLEWYFGSLPVSPTSLTIPSPIPSQRLDAFPPTLIEGFGQDITELLDRSGAGRYEVHSQHFKLMNLEQGQERATITFGALWQPVLALDAWARQSDAQRAYMWHA